MTLPPLPQQVIMKDFMDAHPRAGIFAEPGLGKSRATIDHIRDIIGDCRSGGALILSPKRVNILTWPAELKKWAPDLSFADLRTEKGRTSWFKGAPHVFLCNQEYVQQMMKICMKGYRGKFPPDILVLDELTRWKNPESRRAHDFRRYIHKFDRRIGLTGTPTPNGYSDLFGQIRMLDDGARFGPCFGTFRRRYFESDYMGFNWWLRPEAKEKIEGAIADITLVMRSADWMDIPPVTVEDIEVSLPVPVMKDYLRLEKDMLLGVGDGEEIVAPNAAAALIKLRQFTGGAVFSTNENDPKKRSVADIHEIKIEALRKLHIKLGKQPLLVAVQFTHEVDRILAAIPWARKFNEKHIAEWDAGQIPMWVAVSSGIAVGLNLQGPCSNVFWYSLTYNFEEYHQFNCRIARTGQKNPTTIWRCMVNDTVDWAVAEALRNKRDEQAGLMEAMIQLMNLMKNRELN